MKTIDDVEILKAFHDHFYEKIAQQLIVQYGVEI